MRQTTPNRNRNKSVHDQQREKQSGDQHLLPEDEPTEDPHRPHRMSREDMQKLRPEQPERTDQDKPTQH